MFTIASDEAGYGNWAGPMVIVAVAVPTGWSDPRVTDSKKLTDPKRRTVKAAYENQEGFIIEPVVLSPQAIDSFRSGYKAVLWGHMTAISKVAIGLLDQGKEIDDIVIDGNFPLNRLTLHSVIGELVRTQVKADASIPAAGLASCIAKTIQVDAMLDLHKKYPEYGFNRHKGYGTKAHREALVSQGVSPCHRKSYNPMKRMT